MKISILTLGTRGDVQPFIALALGLKNKGYSVIICAPKSFKKLIEDYRIEFYPISSDYNELLNSPEGKTLLKYYPFSLIFNFKKVILPFIYKGFDEYLDYSKDSDLIIYHPKVLVAPDIAEKYDIPCIIAGTVPMLSRTGEFLNPALKAYINTPKWFNRLSYSINSLLQLPFRGVVNNWRKSRLGLPGRKSFKDITKIKGRTIPIMYSCSKYVVEIPKDWNDTTEMTGYWFLDKTSEYQPHRTLEDFLNNPSPPVCFTFSSLPIKNPKKLIEIVAMALKDTGQRGIIVSGFTDLKVNNIPENILLTGPIPYSRLFPRVKIIVHHGGAGTTAEAIRAKRPMIITPYNVDQPFWAKRCFKSGVSTKPIPFRKLNSRNLAVAINQIMENKSYSQKAEELGKKISSENGVESAIKFIEKMIDFIKNF